MRIREPEETNNHNQPNEQMQNLNVINFLSDNGDEISSPTQSHIFIEQQDLESLTKEELDFMELNKVLFKNIINTSDKKLLIEKIKSAETKDNEDALNKARIYFPKINSTFEQFLQVVQNVLKHLATNPHIKYIPSEEQLRCLLSRSKRKLIDSSAGTGKTTTIVIMQFIEQNIFKYNDGDILSVTYTKAGAKSMEMSYDKLCRVFETTSYLTFTTIHKFCKDLVNMFSSSPKRELTLDKPVVIKKTTNFFDEDTEEFILEEVEELVNANDLMKQALEECSVDISNLPTNISIKDIFSTLAVIKELMISSEDEFRDIELYADFPLNFDTLKKVDETYKDIKFSYNLIDFSDMLDETVRILESIVNGELTDITKIQKDMITYKSIYIDEAQDTSPLQSYIIDLLLKINPNANLTCIGDTDQAIYSFRGGDIRFMLDFPSKYLGDDLDIIYLTRNRRSALPIIETSNELILNNKMRLTRRTRGLENVDKECSISVINDYSNIVAEDFTMKTIRKIFTNNLNNLSDTAILFREHRQVIKLFNRLLLERIPFKYKLSSTCYFNFQETKIFTDIICFLANPVDINFGIQCIGYFLAENPNLLAKITTDLYQGVKLSTSLKNYKCDKLITLLQDLVKSYKKGMSCYELAIHLENHLPTNLLPQSFQTYKEILQYFGRIPASQFISKVSADRKWYNETSKMDFGVTLSTFHSSKGLEWKTVIILPISDSITPNKNRLEILNPTGRRDKYIEEERRLLYVAITRAVNNLIIFYNNVNKDKDDLFISEIKKISTNEIINKALDII